MHRKVSSRFSFSPVDTDSPPLVPPPSAKRVSDLPPPPPPDAPQQPDEILMLILGDLIRVDSPQRAAFRSNITIASVCSTWRRLALGARTTISPELVTSFYRFVHGRRVTDQRGYGQLVREEHFPMATTTLLGTEHAELDDPLWSDVIALEILDSQSRYLSTAGVVTETLCFSEALFSHIVMLIPYPPASFLRVLLRGLSPFGGHFCDKNRPVCIRGVKHVEMCCTKFVQKFSRDSVFSLVILHAVFPDLETVTIRKRRSTGFGIRCRIPEVLTSGEEDNIGTTPKIVNLSRAIKIMNKRSGGILPAVKLTVGNITVDVPAQPVPEMLKL